MQLRRKSSQVFGHFRGGRRIRFRPGIIIDLALGPEAVFAFPGKRFGTNVFEFEIGGNGGKIRPAKCQTLEYESFVDIHAGFLVDQTDEVTAPLIRILAQIAAKKLYRKHPRFDAGQRPSGLVIVAALFSIIECPIHVGSVHANHPDVRVVPRIAVRLARNVERIPIVHGFHRTTLFHRRSHDVADDEILGMRLVKRHDVKGENCRQSSYERHDETGTVETKEM